MTKKTDDEIKDDISINYANSILSATVSTRDNLVKSLTVIASISIPTYVALVKIFNDTISACLLLKAAPVIFFLISLFICFVITLPKEFSIDYKNPIKIIEDHSARLKDTKNLAILACGSEILGLLFMAIVFIK